MGQRTQSIRVESKMVGSAKGKCRYSYVQTSNSACKHSHIHPADTNTYKKGLDSLLPFKEGSRSKLTKGSLRQAW